MLLRLILSIVFAITWRKFKKTFPHRCLANYALIIQYRDSRCEFSIIPLISAFIDEQREKDFISTHFFFIPIFLHDPRSFLHNYSPTRSFEIKFYFFELFRIDSAETIHYHPISSHYLVEINNMFPSSPFPSEKSPLFLSSSESYDLSGFDDTRYI